MDPFTFEIADAAEKGLWFFCHITNEYKTPQQIREMYGKFSFNSRHWHAVDLDQKIREAREKQWRLEANAVEQRKIADQLSMKRTAGLMATEVLAAE